MLPGLRHSALRLGQVMAPLTSAACGGRQMTINGGWGLQNAGLWQRGRHTSVARASAAVAQPLTYQITDTTQLLLQRGDITLFEGDAIVNAANERMLGGGGVDGAIHRAAGPGLREACREVRQVAPGVRCPTGQARLTPGFELPAKAVIHTVGPVYEEDEADECRAELASAYRECLHIANKEGMKRIAFPAISCGVFGYPIPKAAEVAFEMVKGHAGGLREVAFLLHDKPAWDVFCRVAAATAGPPVSQEKDSDSGSASEQDVAFPAKAPRQSSENGSPAGRSPNGSPGGSPNGSPGGSPRAAGRTANGSPRGTRAFCSVRLDVPSSRAASGGDAALGSSVLEDLWPSSTAGCRLGATSRSRSRSPVFHEEGSPSGQGSPRRSCCTASMPAAAVATPAAPGGLLNIGNAGPAIPTGPFISLQGTEDQVANVADMQLNSTARTAEPPADDTPGSPSVYALLANAAQHGTAAGLHKPAFPSAAAADDVQQHRGAGSNQALEPATHADTAAVDAVATAFKLSGEAGKEGDEPAAASVPGMHEAASDAAEPGDDSSDTKAQELLDSALESELPAQKKQRPSA